MEEEKVVSPKARFVLNFDVNSCSACFYSLEYDLG